MKRLSDEEMRVVISDNLALLDNPEQAVDLLFKVAQAQLDYCERQRQEELGVVAGGLEKQLGELGDADCGDCKYKCDGMFGLLCFKEIDQILSLITPLIKQAKRDEKEKLFKLIEDTYPRRGMWNVPIVSKPIKDWWQSLKGKEE